VPYRIFAGPRDEPPRAVGGPIQAQLRAFRQASAISARNRRLHVDVRDEDGVVLWQNYNRRPFPPAADPPTDRADPQAPFLRLGFLDRLRTLR
jgi:hypothetical protein